MAITTDDLVRREAHYCVSFLVSTVAAGYGGFTQSDSLNELIEQAFELSTPVDDWESAAIDEGFTVSDAFISSGWQNLCEEEGIDPHEREVFEHWAVSDWLAGKLAEKGEKVDTDFGGMTVWARTTTGQGIAQDAVIEQIVKDLNGADLPKNRKEPTT